MPDTVKDDVDGENEPGAKTSVRPEKSMPTLPMATSEPATENELVTVSVAPFESVRDAPCATDIEFWSVSAAIVGL